MMPSTGIDWNTVSGTSPVPGGQSTNMQYPYSVVKLDKSIVWAAQNSVKAAVSLKYTIAMIKELDMAVLAEGVETCRQMQSLIDIGCEYFQGYYYSRPVNSTSFVDVVTNKKISGDSL